jgi:hypothetical protein
MNCFKLCSFQINFWVGTAVSAAPDQPPLELRTPEEQLWHSHHTVHIRQAYQNILKPETLRVFNYLPELSEIIYYD